MSKMVSIIIPVYNTALYIEQSLKSVLSQTYKNLEIILINDGSTDNSLEKCYKYKDIDSRVKIINQQNLGVSIARNNGIKEAKGEYLLFVDSDDFVEKKFVEKMVQAIEKVDMAICGYIENYKIANIEHIITNKENILDNISSINKLFDRTYYGGYLWNKIFKTKIIKENSIKFDSNIHMCEDLLFVSKYMLKCKEIKIIPDLLYNYRMRQSSAVWRKNDKKYESLFIAYNELYKLFDDNDISLIYLKYEVLNSIFSNNFKCNVTQKYLNYDILKSYKEVINSKKINSKNKIKLFIKKNFNFVYIRYMNKKVKKLDTFD